MRFHAERDSVAFRDPVTTEVARRVFDQLCLAGFPIDLSVPFLVRARGWQQVAFCQEIGIHRGYFSALLKRQYEVSMNVRYAVHKRLGFDPWATASSNAGRLAAVDSIDPPTTPSSPKNGVICDERCNRVFHQREAGNPEDPGP